MATKKQYEIVGGPSHLDLVNCFAYAYNKRNPHLANFQLSGVGKVELRIVSLAYESGEEGKFEFVGYVVTRAQPLFGCRINGYYNAPRHSGWANAQV